MDPDWRNIFDSVKDEIWEELGELDPNWFETLTAQATSEENVSDQDDLCPNQEGNFKTPFDKPGAESQLFSTPKVFRRGRVVSPEPGNETSFTAEQDKETEAWISVSKEGLPDVKCEKIHLQSQNCFDLLNTPKKSPVSYAQHISESLGAEVNQDISWTSSLNTPAASTLILTKHDKSPSPVSLSAHRNVVFVRELFPSLSNPSRLGALSPKNNDTSQGAVSPVSELPESPQNSLAQSDGVWKQSLPDAIEDGEVRSTVAGVLEGAEDVLSIFFTNSNTALRKVKSDRVKRKQIPPTKEHGCSPMDSTTHCAPASGQKAADEEPTRLSSLPPARTGDNGMTQWSPLSLSDIPPSTEAALGPQNSPTTETQNGKLTIQLFDPSQQVTPTVKVTHSGFTKRKRKFVYTVETPKQPIQAQDPPSQATGIQSSGLEGSMKQLKKATDEAGNVQMEIPKKENLPPSGQDRVQPFDISQLSRDFAQDFSQMPEPVSKVAEDTPRTGFCPSACLSAVKQANQRARQANLHQDWDGDGKGSSVTPADQSHSICELTVSDSGFQSALTDSTNLTVVTFIKPSGVNQQGTAPDPSTSKGNGKARLDDDLKEDKSDAKMSKEVKGSQTHGSSTEGTVDNTDWTPCNGQTHGKGPEKTTVSLPSSHASGFKTASNKGIKITSANLERAKRLFEETEEQKSFSVMPVNHTKAQGSMKSATSNPNQCLSSRDKLGDNSCLLTASQKADVTELCSLLEEADSQFEFTQVRAAKLKQQRCQGSSSSSETVDKELDPDFLTGIDFDESFGSDAEKHPAALTSDVPSNSAGLSLRTEHFSAEDVSHSSKHICTDDGGGLSAESTNLDRAEHTETSRNPLMLGVGFETAGGNVLRVSKKCLLKARALFADLEESQISTDTQISKTVTQTPQNMETHIGNGFHRTKGNAPYSDKQVISDGNTAKSLKSVKVDTAGCRSGFQMASGKGISISAKALKEANAFFQDCEVVGTNPDTALKYKKSLQPSSGGVSHKKTLPKRKNTSFSGGPVDKLEDVNAEPGCLDDSNHTLKETPAEISTSFCGNLPLTANTPLPQSCVTPARSSATNGLSSEGGFCTASGQKVSVSADAVDKAKSLLDDTNTLSKEAVGAVSTPKNSGFQTARGKGVVISAAALRKAKSLLSECADVDDDSSVKPAQVKTRVPPPPTRSSGFVAASGKPVALSAAALQKAKALFSDIDAESPNASDTRSDDRREDATENTEKMKCGFSPAGEGKVHISQKNLSKAKNVLRELDSGPGVYKAMQGAFSEDLNCEKVCSDDGEVQNPSLRAKSTTSNSTGSSSISELSSHGGFSTASGRKVEVSDAALSKAKSLLAENAASEDTDKLPTLPQRRGFQTASGRGVVSSASLNKAKALLSECAEVEDEKPTYSKAPATVPPTRSRGFVAASGKPVSLSAEALQKAKALFSDISVGEEVPAASHTRSTNRKEGAGENMEEILGGFSTARGDKVHVSQKNLSKTSNSTGSSSISELSSHGGFSTASGRKVEVSDAALSKAKSLLAENAASEDTDQQPTLPQRRGFQTASGRGVVVSSASLNKAKALLSECAEVEDEKPTYSKAPATVPPTRSRGFVAVSGKPVSLSAEALQKAKALFSDIRVGEEVPAASHTRSNNRKEGASENLEKILGGFSTVGGGKVHVSHKNLSKPQNLLREVDDGPLVDTYSKSSSNSMTVEQVVSHERMLHSDDGETQNPFLRTKSTTPKSTGSSSISELSSHGGFSTASGRKVEVSDAALSKAKSLLAEDAASEDTDKQPSLPQSRGFQTASGRGVVVSSAALNKAKALLSECAEAEDQTDVKPTYSKAPVTVPPTRSRGFVAASGKPVSLSAEALQKAKALFSDISGEEASAAPHTRSNNRKEGAGENMEEIPGGFSTVGGGKVHVSQKNLSKTSKSTGSSSIRELSSHGGFSTASGRKVEVSDAALSKAKSLLAEDAASEDTDQQPTLPQSRGFQTASGRGVVVSSASLNKAKALLSECAEVEDEKPTYSKAPAPVPPPTNPGFLAASGKAVSLSAEALQKAKALFSDIGVSTELPAVRSSERSLPGDDAAKIHCGFSTAGGAKVYVAQKTLAKARNLMEGFASDERPNSVCAHDPQKSDVSKARDDEGDDAQETTIRPGKSSISLKATERENKTLQTSIVRDCAHIRSTSTDVLRHREEHLTPFELGSLHDSPTEEMPSVLDCEMNPISDGEAAETKRMDESSLVHYQTLNLSGCTETQQLLLAQEALDCTKALLEDESLASERLSADPENVPARDVSKSSYRFEMEQRRGSGKRLMEEDDESGQPPLKRRLLEEFDRSVSGPRASVLCPGTSSPNGLFKDRRVFKYSASLQPNITRPHSNGRNYMDATQQHSAPGVSESTHSKMPTFIPPFLKNLKPESSKKTPLKDNKRTPPAFVPPFKKQRTDVHEGCPKPQDEEDEQRRAFVPPARKTQSSTDVADHIRAGDVQGTSDNAADENQKLPVDCGSERSEASHMEETGCSSQEIFQNLDNIELARDMQHMRLRKKKRQTIRPLPGSLFLIRTSGASRIPLKTAVDGRSPARYSKKQLYRLGVHQHVSEVTSESAEAFRFSLQQFVRQEVLLDRGGVQLADGGWLVPSNDVTAGKQEFYRALCDTPGVDPKLISEEWVYNHYRWIVWKQASMERSFPEMMGGLCLTPEQVLLQLKYRYDVEVDHSRRPALRRIMEKDDTAAKTLVLCVCGVVSRGLSPGKPVSSRTPGTDAKVDIPTAVVWLTDGWYAIRAQLDEALTAMLHRGRLAVGAKIITHGAQLLGSQDACSPLEAPESLMLKICANSCRPARWDAKLGFHRDPRPFLLPVSSLLSNGGPVGCVDVIILRSYPVQWMERKADGGVVFRSVRAEEKEARRHSGDRQRAMELLFSKIQAEFENEEKGKNKPRHRRRTITRQNVARLQDGEELYEAVQDDPAYLEAQLSEQQRETLCNYRRSLLEKKQAELQDRYRQALEKAEDGEGGCPKRDVTPVWRLCVADSMDEPGSVYQLSLWRPPSDLQSLLKEGRRYKVYNLTTSDGRKHVGASMTLQLSGTKKTQFQDMQASQEWLSTRFQPRVCTDFMELQNPEFQPLCGEVDLSGYVVSVVDGQGLSPAFYLADGSLNFLKVRFFSSLAQSGLEDVVKPRALLALSNLRLRGQSTSPTPVVYAAELTSFSTNPKEAHLQESLSQLRNLAQGQENFFLTAEEKLSHLLSSGSLSSASSPALQIRTPVSALDRRTSVSSVRTCQQPNRSLGSFTPVGRNTISRSLSTEKDPKSLKRRRALDYLSRVPSPPPLSPMFSAASPCVSKTFNPPRRSQTPSTLKTVETPARKPVSPTMEDEWVNDEELAMIDTQALLVGDSM